MKIKIENIFLDYANTNLKENPEIFYKIIRDFNSLEFLRIDCKLTTKASGEKNKIGLMEGIIRSFVELVKCDDLQTAIKLRKNLESIENDEKESIELHVLEAAYRHSIGLDFANIDAVFFMIAYQMVFGYENGFCECEDGNGCIYNHRKYFLGTERFTEPERIKCYECDQLFFRYMLEEITKGKEYSNIGSGALKYLLGVAHNNFYPNVVTVETPSKSHFKENLNPFITYKPKIIDSGVFKDAFRSIFIDDIVAYSLCEYLLNNDRRKLKLCEQCNKFFIASKVDARIKFCSNCSPKSKMSKKKRREYQKKYRQKKKQEKLAIQREARIENVMKRAGYSRREAIEIIETDESMM